MKFIALAAIAVVAAQDEAAAEETEATTCAEGECPVTDEAGVTTCTAQADVDASEGAIVCDAPAEDGTMEEEGSSALFAGLAAVAVTATMMY